MWPFSSTPPHLAVKQEELQNAMMKKRVLIVGGTAGIGKALAIHCMKRGAEVTIVGRRKPDESLKAAQFISKDLALMKNAQALTSELNVSKYDIAIFSNGIMTGSVRQESAEMIELDMAVSYLSRFAFASKLFGRTSFGFDRSDQTRKPRIFIIGFPGYKNEATVDDFNQEKEYKQWAAHMNTVVGNEALVRFWSENDKNVNVYGINPGLIQTEIRDAALGKGSWLSWVVESLIGSLSKSASQYADNILGPLLVAPALEDMNLALFKADGTLLKANPWLESKINYDRVIQESQKLLQKALA
jgi:NAD(P)-dependent dehydrogenase (short-subunit alcohol dehydrogenase family)